MVLIIQDYDILCSKNKESWIARVVAYKYTRRGCDADEKLKVTAYK